MGTGPIFIGGPDRCGKTTLRAFLQTHENISIPAVGSNMWTYFYGQYGDLSSPDNLERCLYDMLNYKHVRFLAPDIDLVRREFAEGPATYARLFAIFQKQHARREGKPRWGDQTGLIERYADQIFAAYPDAKIIHMLRDPRDRYAGSLALWPNGKGRVGGATARWLYSTLLGERNLKKYPGRYMLVRFENMVRDPEQTVKAVCKFVNEPYHPTMLTMASAPEHRAKLAKRSTKPLKLHPLSDEYIGIYRRSVSRREIAFMQGILGYLMKKYGYGLEPMFFSLKDMLAFLFIDWPLNLARMTAWLVVELLQHNMPTRFGRKPGENMYVNSTQATPKAS